jgi:hypothetical protein
VTLAEFQSSARVSVASQSTDLLNNRDLLWRVMAEELNEEQVSPHRRLKKQFVIVAHNLTRPCIELRCFVMFLISRVFLSRYRTCSISPQISTRSLALIEMSRLFSRAGAQETSCPEPPRAGGCSIGAIEVCSTSVTFDCSWTLKLPDCIVPGDKAPDYPMSRARMRAGEV